MDSMKGPGSALAKDPSGRSSPQRRSKTLGCLDDRLDLAGDTAVIAGGNASAGSVRIDRSGIGGAGRPW
jgi:hypothetical protein